MTYVNKPDQRNGATVRWVFADATARTNFAPLHGGPKPQAHDIGSEAWQLSDDSFWSLKAVSPVTWVSKSSGGGGGISGPGTTTDKALVRWNGTDGSTVQDGHLTENDAGQLTSSELGTIGIPEGGVFPLGASAAAQKTITSGGTDTVTLACPDPFASHFHVFALGYDTTTKAVYFRESKIFALRAGSLSITTRIGSALFDEFDAGSTGWDATFVAYSVVSNNFTVTLKADPAHDTKWTVAILASSIPFPA
jgi:hypothetical protein